MTLSGSDKIYELEKLICANRLAGSYLEGILTKRRHKEPSGTLGMFYILICMVATWLHT